MSVRSKLISECPSIKVTQNQITATTSVVWQIVNLGTFRRQVVIDSLSRKVTIKGRFFWFFRKSEEIPFSQIKGVMYGFTEFGAAGSYVTGESEGQESFNVGLRLHSGKDVPLFAFEGEGAYVQHNAQFWEIPRGMIETALDMSGTQQEDSLEFVDLLCARLGVPISF